MRDVPASRAKTRLAQLLDQVERGETVTITRRGRRIARIVPETGWRQREIEEAIVSLKALARENRENQGRMTMQELLALRREGHKY